MFLKNHYFHLVNQSPWPLISSFSLMIMMTGVMKLFYNNFFFNYIFYMGIMIVFMVMYQWWRDIIRESTFQGNHTMKISRGLKFSMLMFIMSEIFFFISFFWAFFHSSLTPTIELGLFWPPTSVFSFDPLKIPLLNTIILLTSGITVTWTHHNILKMKLNFANKSLFLTIILGIYFSLLQSIEYLEAEFSISDSSYGSTFFMTTGFHGLHVLIGTLFLLICLIRQFSLHFSNFHHFGFEAAAWYWHFVDIIWLFLFISIYWWGS